jgi:beta-lactamase regulating signal transducer with metallopeptidase domain
MNTALQPVLLLSMPAAGTGSVPAAFVWVWNTSLAALALIGLVLLIQLGFKKFLPARACYALWLLVVLRLVLPAVPSSPFSIFNLGDTLSRPSPLHPPSTGLPVARGRSEGPATPPRSKGGEAPFQTVQVVEGSPPAFGSALWAAAPWVWLLGASGYLVAVLVWHRRFSRCVGKQASAASPRVTSILEEAKAILRLRRDIRVLEIDSLRGPSLFGFLRPCILLSRSVLEQLDDRELRLLFLHELVHFKRWDVLQNWLLILLQALHWFNPLVWLAFRRLRSTRELVCDATVLSHLDTGDRHAYGTTLIKMLDCFSRTPLVPSLVPILNRKSEIHRRIVMIANFKSTARLATVVSTVLAVALGLLTFTSAAEKPLVKPAEVPPAEPPPARQKDAQERGLKILEGEVAKRDQEIREKQQYLDDLRRDLQISDPEETRVGGAEPPRQLETLRVEAMAEFTRVDTLYSYLTNLPRSELKKAIPTVVPDSVLSGLQSRQAEAEQKLAELTESYGKEHPDVKRTRSLLETINRQIEERFEGLVAGLRAKRESEKAALGILQTYQQKSIETAIQRRPYLQARRDLENLQYIREKLIMRIMQEKIDAAMSRQP